jgi:hypothetical protein
MSELLTDFCDCSAAEVASAVIIIVWVLLFLAICNRYGNQ